MRSVTSSRAEGFSTEVAAFDYQYKNLQVSEFLGAAQAYIVNAAQSRIYGLEDEFHLQLADPFPGEWRRVVDPCALHHLRCVTRTGHIVRRAGLRRPARRRRPDCAIYHREYVPAPILHGTHMQHVPDYTANLGPRYTTGMTDTGEYSVSGNAYFSSYYFNSPAGTQFRQPSYTTLALRTQWDDPSKRYFVALYGNNITNVRYRTQVQYNGFGIGASWDMPATWGIELGAKL